jgi:DNA-directed RNA polymerase subunit RPC12/RpoP
MKTKMISILYCDSCNWKRLFRNSDDIDLKEFGDKRYKCLSCGRMLKLKKAPDPQKDLDLAINKEKQKKEMENWLENIEKYQQEFENE